MLITLFTIHDFWAERAASANTSLEALCIEQRVNLHHFIHLYVIDIPLTAILDTAGNLTFMKKYNDTKPLGPSHVLFHIRPRGKVPKWAHTPDPYLPASRSSYLLRRQTHLRNLESSSSTRSHLPIPGSSVQAQRHTRQMGPRASIQPRHIYG